MMEKSIYAQTTKPTREPLRESTRESAREFAPKSRTFMLDEVRLHDAHFSKRLDKVLDSKGINYLYPEAQSCGLITAPEGLDIFLQKNTDIDYSIYLESLYWGSLKIYAGFGYLDEYKHKIGTPLNRSHVMLRRAVLLANKGIEDLTRTSEAVIAQFSGDLGLLSVLASSGDSTIRSLIMENNKASDELKVLVSLRDTSSNH